MTMYSEDLRGCYRDQRIEFPPTFEATRSTAFDMLSIAEDELRSTWESGAGPTRSQARAIKEAKLLIGRAKDALEGAGS